MGGIQMQMCIQCKEKWFEVKLDRGGLQEVCFRSETAGSATGPSEMPDGLQPSTQVE
jgi:hypothetical protein